MSIRTGGEHRLVAGVLSVVWLPVAALTALYGAGGVAQPLVGMVALVPFGLCLLAMLRAQDSSVRPGALLLAGMAALLLTLPLLPLLFEPLLDESRAPALASTGIALALVGALVLSCLYGALLQAQPRRALAVAAASGGLTLLVLLATSIVAPPDVRALPGCGPPRLLEEVRFEASAYAAVDARTVATARLEGERSASDERWSAQRSGELVPDGRIEVVRLTGTTWLRVDDGRWQEVAGRAGSATASSTVEGRVAGELAARQLEAAEDLGVELLDGDPSRHCRLMVAGTTAGEAIPLLGWLLGGTPLESGTDLPVWRGELDWWIDGDGRLRRTELLVGGHPADAWQQTALRGLLRAELSVVPLAEPARIEAPLP